MSRRCVVTVCTIAASLWLMHGAIGQTIGFAQVGSESDWRTAFTADMKAEAVKRGVTLLYADADNDVERQRQAWPALLPPISTPLSLLPSSSAAGQRRCKRQRPPTSRSSSSIALSMPTLRFT